MIGLLLMALWGAGQLPAPPQPAASAAPAAAQPYVDALVSLSRQGGVSHSPAWTSLLHLAPHSLVGAPRSEATGPRFFLAPNGATDPQAEMEATLRAFFAPPVVEVIPQATPGELRGDQGVQHPQCRFPARYAFLKRALHFDPARLPEQPCPRLQTWLSRVDAGPASVVFAAAYLGHPASLFGHTYLQLERRSAPGQPLLGYAVNFAANITTNNPLLYAWDGVAGGFDGTFSLLPTYLKVKEYSDLEARDLWEYRLSLTQPEVDRMLLHLWELGTTWFDYHFASNNCSYQLLSLIEVAREGRVELRARFPLYASPVDTLRVLEAVPGLVVERKRRPSLRSRLAVQRAALAPEELPLVDELADHTLAAARGEGERALPPALVARLTRLSPERQAAVLDAALDLSQLRLGGARGEEVAVAAAERPLVFRRARLPSPATPPEAAPGVSPDRAHGAFLALAGGGRDQAGNGFGSVLLRPVLHDLLSRAEGSMPDQVFELLRTELRFTSRSFELRELRVLHIENLDPFDPWLPKPGWRINTGFFRERQRGDEIQMGALKAGPTLSLAPWNQLVYLALDAELDVGGAFRDRVRGRLDPAAGLALRPLPGLKLQGEAGLRLEPGDSRARPLAAAAAAYELGAWQARAALQWSDGSRDLSVWLGTYF